MEGFDKNRTGTGTREWAEVTENIQRGCVNNCLYCYAAHNAARFGWRTRSEWQREELTKRADMKTYPAREGVVMFPSSHDITPFNVGHFIRVATIILQKGNRLLIVSKPRLDCIIDVCKSLAPWKGQILFRFTIGAMDETLTALWEPGAPRPEERLEAMKYASSSGYAVSVSIEPMLAGGAETCFVIAEVSQFHPETIWIGKMNKIRLRVADKSPAVMEAVKKIERQQSDSEIMKLHTVAKSVPAVRWKDSIKMVLETHGQNKQDGILSDVQGKILKLCGIIERQREALERIITEGDFTAPEGMTRIAREAREGKGPADGSGWR